MRPEDITEECMVELACGWILGPVKKTHMRISNITNQEPNIVSAWRADNHSCGYGFSWTVDGKHVGNPEKVDHPLHIVRVVETEDRLKLEMYDKAMDGRPKSCKGLTLEETIRVLSLPLPTPRKEFRKVHETDNSITYGVDFPLPDDDTMGVERSLRVRVEVPDNGGSVEVRLSVREQSGKVHPVGSFETADLACIANLLYPVAEIQLHQRIVQRP